MNRIQKFYLRRFTEGTRFYEKTNPIFSTSPVTGKWLFSIGNFTTGNGGATVKQLSITFDYMPPYVKSEKEALRDMFNSAALSRVWKDDVSGLYFYWDRESPCDFQRVTCGEDNRVTKINLENCWLSGSIPDSIKNLPFLQSLNLSSNELTFIQCPCAITIICSFGKHDT